MNFAVYRKVAFVVGATESRGQRIKGTDPIKESSFRNHGADPEKDKEPIDLRH